MPVYPPASVVVQAPGLLKVKEYNPASVVVAWRNATTFADIDATNLVVSFVAPASGKVIVKLSASVGSDNGGVCTGQWNLRNASGDIPNTKVQTTGISQGSIGVSRSIPVSGLTPGVTYVWTWGQAIEVVGGNGANTKYGGNSGPASMEVWDANPTYSQQLIQPGIGAPERIEAGLGADAPIVANTIVSILTISLPPGTWQVGATALGQNVGGWFHIKVHIGATIYGSMEAYNSANGGGCALSVPVRRIVVPPGSNQTISLSGGTDASSGNFKHKAILTVFNTGTEGTVTRLWATREAA